MNRCAVSIIPTLNEAARIGALLAQLARLPNTLLAEIIVADGGSDDATRAIVLEAAAREPRIRLVDNPARIQSAGVNRAVAVADPTADTIVRIDAHAAYPDDYVPRVLAAFASTGADMIATRLNTQGTTCLQQGIAAAVNSRIGSGGSAHRVGGRSGFVDHGHHAGMDRRLFETVGGYDERFVANEDAELDYRVRRAGGRIWLAADIEFDYFPRKTLGALFTQYRRYGAGRAGTFLKHRERLRLRQVLPAMLVPVLAGSVALAPFAPMLLGIPFTYVAILALATAGMWRQARSRCTLAALPAMATMHIAWSIGFVGRLIGAASRRHAGWTVSQDGVSPRVERHNERTACDASK